MKRILVVEDDATTRHLLSTVLKGAKFSVVTAADGKAGTEIQKNRCLWV